MKRHTEFPWHIVIGIIGLIFLASSIFYYVHSKSECNAEGGVLVKNALGLYACVDKAAVK